MRLHAILLFPTILLSTQTEAQVRRDGALPDFSLPLVTTRATPLALSEVHRLQREARDTLVVPGYVLVLDVSVGAGMMLFPGPAQHAVKLMTADRTLLPVGLSLDTAWVIFDSAGYSLPVRGVRSYYVPTPFALEAFFSTESLIAIGHRDHVDVIVTVLLAGKPLALLRHRRVRVWTSA